MKSRDIAHPKLFLKCYLDSDSVRLKYLSNKFNSKGDRLVEELSDDIPDEFSEGLSKTFFLTKLNKNELMKLDIFIDRQNKLISKMVNKDYDRYMTVKASLDTLLSFKEQFRVWFRDNDEL